MTTPHRPCLVLTSAAPFTPSTWKPALQRLSVTTGGVLIDCAVDNDGILYAVDIGSDVFGSIDKVTATFTTIANLPFDANYAQGMQCDHGCRRGVSCSLQQFHGCRPVVQC